MEKLRILILFVIAAPFGASAMVGCGQGVAVQDPPVNANRGKAQPKKTLRAFSSEQEMTAYFRQIAEESKRELRRRRRRRRYRSLSREIRPGECGCEGEGRE